jgi:hypothetical protein
MHEEDAVMFLQSLRGSQAVIALAFVVLQRALTVKELERFTGLDKNTIGKSLNALKDKGKVFEQRGEHGRCTWLPLGGTFFAQLLTQNPKLSDSGAIVVNVESEERESLYSTSSLISSQNPRIAETEKEPRHWQHLPKRIEDIRACMALLRSAGIVGKKAENIAEDHHITVDMIKAHLAWVKTEQWDRPLGMVIYRLEQHVEPPELNELGHVVDCRCDECRGLRAAKRYTEGAFSVMLNRESVDIESEKQ